MRLFFIIINLNGKFKLVVGRSHCQTYKFLDASWFLVHNKKMGLCLYMPYGYQHIVDT